MIYLLDVLLFGLEASPVLAWTCFMELSMPRDKYITFLDYFFNCKILRFFVINAWSRIRIDLQYWIRI
jgi:hypothetical protein